MDKDLALAMVNLGWVKWDGDIWLHTALQLTLPFDAAVAFELKETLEERASNSLFRDCLKRTRILWQKENPDKDYWPDGAVSLSWLRKKIDLLEEEQ